MRIWSLSQNLRSKDIPFNGFYRGIPVHIHKKTADRENGSSSFFQKKQQDFVKREFREVLSALWRWDGGGGYVPLFSAVLRPAAAHLSAKRRCARHSAFRSVCDGEDDILFEIAEFFSEYIETARVFRIRLISNAYGNGRVGGKVKLMNRQIRDGRSIQKAACFR